MSAGSILLSWELLARDWRNLITLMVLTLVNILFNTLNLIDEGKTVIGSLMDMSKAFVRICHFLCHQCSPWFIFEGCNRPSRIVEERRWVSLSVLCSKRPIRIVFERSNNVFHCIGIRAFYFIARVTLTKQTTLCWNGIQKF